MITPCKNRFAAEGAAAPETHRNELPQAGEQAGAGADRAVTHILTRTAADDGLLWFRLFPSELKSAVMRMSPDEAKLTCCWLAKRSSAADRCR